MNKATAELRLFVLDTSVLLHDPTALFRFQEHDICLPVPVLLELDRCKRGTSEEAQNARQTSRFLDGMLADVRPPDLEAGLPIAPAAAPSGSEAGRLFFAPGGGSGDDAILEAALEQQRTRPVTLVSKDINLRIRATVAGLHAEDFESDRVLDDVDLLYSGVAELPPDVAPEPVESRRFRVAARTALYPNEAVFPAEGPELRIRDVENGHATATPLENYRDGYATVWGMHARNREQNFALNLLMDPGVDFVTLLGAAGTGKTLLALAAGLAQCFDDSRYREIIMTRATVSIGVDIGHLPGTEEEKMTPWMGALMDNLEVLGTPAEGGRWGQAATEELLRSRVRIRSLNFMRGRTFLDRYIILDEAQNLTPKQMKTLITRAGPGTKIVCLGNIAQIDTPYLTGTTSGLTYVVDRFRAWPHGGHVTLQRGERSRLADFASESL